MIEVGSDRAGDMEYPRLIKFDRNGNSVYLLGTVKGLLSESTVVRDVILDKRPVLIGIHVSLEEISGLEKVVDGIYDETPMSPMEKIYAMKLSGYGEVQIPPPSLVQALKCSREMKIPLFPLDMDEEEYSEAFTSKVGSLTLIRQSLDMKRINRMKFNDPDAGSFVLHWDRVANGMSDFRNLESAREEKMARMIAEHAEGALDCLFILELERLEGIRKRLTTLNV